MDSAREDCICPMGKDAWDVAYLLTHLGTTSQQDYTQSTTDRQQDTTACRLGVVPHHVFKSSETSSRQLEKDSKFAADLERLGTAVVVEKHLPAKTGAKTSWS